MGGRKYFALWYIAMNSMCMSQGFFVKKILKDNFPTVCGKKIQLVKLEVNFVKSRQNSFTEFFVKSSGASKNDNQSHTVFDICKFCVKFSDPLFSGTSELIWIRPMSNES